MTRRRRAAWTTFERCWTRVCFCFMLIHPRSKWHTCLAGAALETERSSRLVAWPGAEVNARDDQSRTALHAAAANGHTETAALLLDRGTRLACSHPYAADTHGF
jgi:ankyrin repeat protein